MIIIIIIIITMITWAIWRMVSSLPTSRIGLSNPATPETQNCVKYFKLQFKVLINCVKWKIVKNWIVKPRHAWNTKSWNLIEFYILRCVKFQNSSDENCVKWACAKIMPVAHWIVKATPGKPNCSKKHGKSFIHSFLFVFLQKIVLSIRLTREAIGH